MPAPGPDALASALSSQTGVEEISPVFRTAGQSGPLASRTSFDLLGVDPATFDEVAFFRSDFASDSLGGLLEQLGPTAGGNRASCCPLTPAGWDYGSTR